MKLTCLGSSSKGNCYILEGKSDKLVLEAGIKFKEVTQALDFKLDDVVGCLVTHEHKDHLGHVNSFLLAGINIYGTLGTLQGIFHHNACVIEVLKQYDIGEFKVIAFDSIHDTREPVNYLIQSKETGEKLLFITDSAYCKYKFQNVDYLMIETNYEESLINKALEDGVYPEFLINRIKLNHMELNTALEIIKNGIYKHVILMHLSEQNSDVDMFRNKALEVNKKVDVACKGLKLTLGE